MRKLLILCLSATLLYGCELEKIISQSSGEGSITEYEAAMGLKEALNFGISRGADRVSMIDGYFKNELIKIPFPPEAVKIENTLRNLGLGSEVDKVVLTINRAAEDAAQKAKPIFVQAIKDITIRDAMNILFGGNHAATDYLQNATYNPLATAFSPEIKTSLDKVNATKYWEDAMNIYNKIPLVEKINPDLTAYVTGKALDGLFIVVGEEEQKIRENPIKRTSEILKKVFGYYDRNK